jgi:hypothetical protein
MPAMLPPPRRPTALPEDETNDVSVKGSGADPGSPAPAPTK